MVSSVTKVFLKFNVLYNNFLIALKCLEIIYEFVLHINLNFQKHLSNIIAQKTQPY
jgi:hypothetical protein